MGEDPDSERLSFLGKRLPPTFEVRVVSVRPGRERVEDAVWRDTLVVVEYGEVELEFRRGGRLCFRRGSVLWLTGLPLCALCNRGREPAVLVGVSRRGGRGE
jgi:hypothetical protein